MEWTREKTLSLINEYRKRRGLWDMTHDDYRKKEIKSKLLLEVSNSIGGGIPIVEIEKKFHTLRTQYHRELNRIKRKEPYNSKWFGFNNLQFLSSPKACRSNNKGRVKEITEEGTVTTKYILREAPLDNNNSGRSPNSSNNTSEEFVSINQRKSTTTAAGTTIDYESTGATNRSHELEKLIEETTKDVDMEDAKPKTIESNTYDNSHSDMVSVHGGEQQLHAVDSIDAKLHEEQMEALDNIGDETDINYQASNANHHDTISNPVHHYIKIQRRESDGAAEYYEEQQQTSPHIHSIVASNGKRIYYDTNGQQHTATILATGSTSSTSHIANSSTILNTGSPPTTKIHHTTIKHVIPPRSAVLGNTVMLTKQQQQQQQQEQQISMSSQQCSRDELSTYGEYVANEMRSITNREILIALKHKINTALFEASMAELQK